VAVMMMMPMRPEMIQNAHLLNPSLNKPTLVVNLPRSPKNRYDKRVFWMLNKIWLSKPAPLLLFCTW